MELIDVHSVIHVKNVCTRAVKEKYLFFFSLNYLLNYYLNPGECIITVHIIV